MFKNTPGVLLWCSGIGSVSERWDTGWIPGLAQWVKAQVLPQRQAMLWLQLGLGPRPGNSTRCRVAKKGDVVRALQ